MSVDGDEVPDVDDFDDSLMIMDSSFRTIDAKFCEDEIPFDESMLDDKQSRADGSEDSYLAGSESESDADESLSRATFDTHDNSAMFHCRRPSRRPRRVRFGEDRHQSVDSSNPIELSAK